MVSFKEAFVGINPKLTMKSTQMEYSLWVDSLKDACLSVGLNLVAVGLEAQAREDVEVNIDALKLKLLTLLVEVSANKEFTKKVSDFMKAPTQSGLDEVNNTQIGNNVSKECETLIGILLGEFDLEADDLNCSLSTVLLYCIYICIKNQEL